MAPPASALSFANCRLVNFMGSPPILGEDERMTSVCRWGHWEVGHTQAVVGLEVWNCPYLRSVCRLEGAGSRDEQAASGEGTTRAYSFLANGTLGIRGVCRYVTQKLCVYQYS